MPQQSAFLRRQAEKWLDVIVSVVIVFVWRQTTPWSYCLCVKADNTLKLCRLEGEEFCHLYKAGSPWRIVRMTHDLHHLLNWRVIGMKEKNFAICTRQAHLGELWEWHTTCIIFSTAIIYTNEENGLHHPILVLSLRRLIPVIIYVTSPILISILTSLNGGKLCTDFRGFTNSTKHTRWWYEQY